MGPRWEVIDSDDESELSSVKDDITEDFEEEGCQEQQRVGRVANQDRDELGEHNDYDHSTNSTNASFFQRVYEDQQDALGGATVVLLDMDANAPDNGTNNTYANRQSQLQLPAKESGDGSSSLTSITDPVPASRKQPKKPSSKKKDAVIDLSTQVTTPSKPNSGSDKVARADDDPWGIPSSSPPQHTKPTRTYGKRKREAVGQQQFSSPRRDDAPAVDLLQPPPPAASAQAAAILQHDPYDFPESDDELSSTRLKKKKIVKHGGSTVSNSSSARKSQQQNSSSPAVTGVIPQTASVAGAVAEQTTPRSGGGGGGGGGGFSSSDMPATLTTSSLYIAPSALTASQKQEYRMVSFSSQEPSLPALPSVYKSSGVSTVAYPTPSRFVSSAPMTESPGGDRASEGGDGGVLHGDVASAAAGTLGSIAEHPLSSPDIISAIPTSGKRKRRGAESTAAEAPVAGEKLPLSDGESPVMARKRAKSRSAVIHNSDDDDDDDEHDLPEQPQDNLLYDTGPQTAQAGTMIPQQRSSIPSHHEAAEIIDLTSTAIPPAEHEEPPVVGDGDNDVIATTTSLLTQQEAEQEDPAPTKKKRGRKKKETVVTKKVVEEEAVVEEADTGMEHIQPPPAEEEVAEPSAVENTVVEPEPEPAAKRKRGRPRKVDTPTPKPAAIVLDDNADSSYGAVDNATAAPTPAPKTATGPAKRGRKKKKKEDGDKEDTAASPLLETPRSSRNVFKKQQQSEQAATDSDYKAGADDGNNDDDEMKENKLPTEVLKADVDAPVTPSPAMAPAAVKKEATAASAIGNNRIGTPGSGKVQYRVGLSKRSRIAPLLKSLRK
ncbi:hypothetical protein B0T17DRAFT_611632 [Bombardia bombarda]|uniref:AT hook domain-containing protein n=1 Tax=Bombardia bombarda TaxID=252184 RepID=A0AA39XJX9_9PEZI|nr:hypothetical protein B0T17DRAFT_611632 [Bombardia bombarda]